MLLEPPDLLDAVKKWRPDPTCIAAGDEHLIRALRCYAAAGLSDAQISDRLVDEVGNGVAGKAPYNVMGFSPLDAYTIVLQPDTAAIMVARQLAFCGMRARAITLTLADLAGLLPGWPEDPDHLIYIGSEADSVENGDA